MKKRISRNFIFIFIACVILCALLGVVLSSTGTFVAAAKDVPEFAIATQGNNLWTLKKGGVQIAQYTGVFFEYQNPNTVAAKMLEKIRAELVADGIINADYLIDHEYTHNLYSLHFDLPQADTSLFNDVNTMKYSTTLSGIIVYGEHENIANSDTTRGLQYKSVDGAEFSSYWQAEVAGRGLSFGKNVDVGEYDVRYVATESFVFDGANVVATHYGNTVRCVIEKAHLNTPQHLSAKATYGATLDEIAGDIVKDGAISNIAGRFVLSQSQDGGFDGDYIPEVGNFTAKYDFVPFAQNNYEVCEDIEVSITVEPKTINIFLGNAYSLVGDAVKDVSAVEYVLDAEQLAHGDSLLDLNLEIFFKDAVDKDRAGEYYIDASIDNDNYILETHNLYSQFIDYGVYTVYSRRTVVNVGNISFEIYCNEGFVALDVNVVEQEFSRGEYAKQIVVGYAIEFRTYDGEAVVAPDDFTVSWTKVPLGAKWVSTANGELFDVESTHHLTVSKDEGGYAILFWGDKALPPTSANELSLTNGHIALISVCFALALSILGIALWWNGRKKLL